MTIYQYGWAAWVWRVLIAFGLAAGGALVAVALRDRALESLLTALPLLAPSLYFGYVLAVRIDVDGPVLRVWTLIFWRRTIALERIRPGRVSTHAQGYSGPIHAPRAFVPVRRGLAIYVDLLATIPDKRRFHDALRLPRP